MSELKSWKRYNRQCRCWHVSPYRAIRELTAPRNLCGNNANAMNMPKYDRDSKDLKGSKYIKNYYNSSAIEVRM